MLVVPASGADDGNPQTHLEQIRGEKHMNSLVAQRVVEILLAARQLQEISAGYDNDKEILELLYKISWLGYIGSMEMNP
jgi:hypothetical protein